MSKDKGKSTPPSAIMAKPQSGRGAGAPPLVPQDLRLSMALRQIGFPGQREGVSSPFVAGPQPAPAAMADALESPVHPSLALARRDWILGVMERQRALSSRTSGVVRRRDLPAEDFLDYFYAPGRPVVIEGAISEWPALTRWTPDYLRAAVGNAMIEYQGGRTRAADFELLKDNHKKQIAFDAFMTMIEGRSGNDAYITAYNSGVNQAALAPLQSDLRYIDAYMTPAHGMMWIGPAGTFTPLHFDLTNNLLAQVIGRKSVLLIPPSDSGLMCNHRHVFSAVHDIRDETQLRRYPLARQAHVHEVLLSPGDLLYIPIGWWHQVRALDFSVTLTYTNFRWPNEGHESFPAG